MAVSFARSLAVPSRLSKFVGSDGLEGHLALAALSAAAALLRCNCCAFDWWPRGGTCAKVRHFGGKSAKVPLGTVGSKPAKVGHPARQTAKVAVGSRVQGLRINVGTPIYSGIEVTVEHTRTGVNTCQHRCLTHTVETRSRVLPLVLIHTMRSLFEIGRSTKVNGLYEKGK